MSKAAIFFNQGYIDNPENYPKQSGKLFELYDRLVHGGQTKVTTHGMNFQAAPGVEMVDHFAKQMVGQIRELTNSRVIVFFGDGGTGLFLAGLDKLGQEVEPAVRHNPVCLGPGGTYIHGAKAMGTDRLDQVVDFARGDFDGRDQKVKIRQASVVKTDLEKDQVIEKNNHHFYGFAGTSFESYILELNEQKSRNGGILKNSMQVIGQATRDVFGGMGKKVSRLRAFTTMPRWGFARFWPEVESLDEDSFYMLGSDNAGPLDMLKVTAVVNSIGSNRILLKAALAGIDIWKRAGQELKPKSMADILDKFRPKKLQKFAEEFDGSLLGGLSYSTDGFPHKVDLKNGQSARFEIDTVPNSGVKVIREN